MSRRISNNTAVIKGVPKLVIPPTEEYPSGTYLLAFGEKTPDIYTKEIQEGEEKRSAMIQIIYFDAARKIADARNISEDAALKMLFPQKFKIEGNDGKITEVTKEAEESILAWISKEEFANLSTYNNERLETIDLIVTLLYYHRILYAVRVVEAAGVKTRSLKVTAPWFALGKNDWLSLNGVHFQVQAAYDPETGEIGVDGLPRAVQPGDTLFVMKHDRSGYEVGDDDWKEELTRQLKGADKALLYNFFLSEMGRLDLEDSIGETGEGEDETPLLIESPNLSPGSSSPQLTGESSTTDSTTAETPQNNSDPITTEAVPVA